MLKLIEYEFRKLRRRPLLILATLASILLPIPVSILAARTGQGYDFIYKIVINIGHFVLLIPVLCIIGSLLFFEERDNQNITVINTRTRFIPWFAWEKRIV